MAPDLYGRDLKRQKLETADSSSKKKHQPSSSSFLDLKAQLAAKKSQAQDGDDTSSSKGKGKDADYFARKERKLPRDLRPSPGSASTSSSSSKKKPSSTYGGTSTLSSWSNTPSAQLERERNAILERKAKLYEQLQAGKSGGYRPEDLRRGGRLNDGGIDWERKRLEDLERDGQSSDEEEEEEDEGGEELVEYVDELGRSRMIPRSQVPMDYLQRKQEEGDNFEQDDLTVYGPQAAFPILARSSHPDKSMPRDDDPLESLHFDSTAEVRNRGAGFFRFDTEEGKRRAQMEALQQDRLQTELERERRGIVDEEGDRSNKDQPRSLKGRGQARLQEREALVQSKRAELARRRRLQHIDGDDVADEDGNKEQERRQTAAVDLFLDQIGSQYQSRAKDVP